MSRNEKHNEKHNEKYSIVMKSIAVKLTNRCNLNCLHCYDTIARNNICDMPAYIRNQTIKYIRKQALENSTDIYLITLIGGEIGILNPDVILHFMEELLDLHNVCFMISTNLTYELSEKWMKIFRNSINPTTGIPTITSSWDESIRFKTQTQEEKTLNNIKYLYENGIVVSVSTVLTTILLKNKTPKQLFQMFQKYSITTIVLEPLVPIGNAIINKNIIPLNRDKDKWLSNAYLALKQYPTISFEDFDELEYAIRYKTSLNLCNSLDDECVVNTNGSLAFLKNNSQQTYGNVFGEFDTNKYFKLSKCIHYYNEECIRCKFYGILCHGTCRTCLYDDSGCPGHKLLFDVIQQYVKKQQNLQCTT